MKKRSYSSATRETQAAETRNSILKAAKRLFQIEGFDQVTIQKLAKAAHVSMPTIYALFKSKRGLLHCLIDEALPSAQFEALVALSMQEKSPLKRLRITAKLARQIYDAERGLIDLMRGASVVAPEFKELEQERERRRHRRQREFVKQMTLGVPLKKARDILWTLTGRDLYRLLVIERGWTSAAYEKWLAQLLVKALA